jgi:hypothetical protein
MSKKKDALKDLLVKARALSEIDSAERTEEQNTELKSYMDRGQELRNEIQRDGALDSFAETVADTDPDTSAKSAEADYAVLGHDGGRPNAPQLVAEKKGFEDAVKAWKAGQRGAKWGFDVRYKTDLSTSTSETGFGAEQFGGATTNNGNQFGGTVAPFYYPGIIEPPTRTPLIGDLFAQGSTELAYTTV